MLIRNRKPILSRRQLLRGTAGTGSVAMGLPWLQAMADETPGRRHERVDAEAADGTATDQPLDRPPVRSAFLFMPNGVNPEGWACGVGEPGGPYELSRMLRSLEPVRDDIVVLENLHHPNLNNRNGHWPKVPAFLSGGHVLRTAGRDMDTGGISADQLMAREIGTATPLPSLELGIDSAYTGVDNLGGGFTRIYGSHIAWRDPHTPVPNEIVPQLAFDRLFRGTSTKVVSGLNVDDPQVVASLRRDNGSVLDAIQQDARNLLRRVGHEDRSKLDEYLQSVRSVERRIEASLRPQRRWINASGFDLSRPSAGIPEQHVEHVRLMLDLLVLAFWTDTTRVATFMMGNAQTGRNFGFIDGVNGSFHGISHHRNEPGLMQQYEKIGEWHVQQLAYLLKRMSSLREGDSTLLDNCMVLFGSALRDGNRHATEDLPLVLAGRGGSTIRSGRRLISPEKTPLCNLYVTMLNTMGVPVDKFGTSKGTLNLG